MTVTVEIALTATNDLVEGLNHLLPQLSSSASALTRSDVEVLVASPSSRLFVGRDDNRIVGVLTLVVFAIPSGLRAWIEDVVVDESTRGTGVGEALTRAALEEAKRRGVRSVDLTSRPARIAANSLYQKLGFELRSTNVYRYVIE